MIKEDILRMAREAGMALLLEEHAGEYGNGTLENTPYPELERFASLVAAHVQQAAPPQITHAEGCWSWGPAHYACACAEVAKLKGWGNGL